MSGSIIVALSRAITAHGKELNELELREPTVKDVMELGYPYLVHGGGADTAVELRPQIAGKYAVRLAGIPQSSVEQLSVPDLQKVQGAVMSFFSESESEPAT